MSAPKYLEKRVVRMRRTDPAPRPRLTADGYTVRAGSPTPYVVTLECETRERRLMVWHFSNAGTVFLRIGGEPFIVRGCDLPDPT